MSVFVTNKQQSLSSLMLVVFMSVVSVTINAQTANQETIRNLKTILAEPVPAKEQLAASDAQAKRKCQAAIELLFLGQREVLWPLLKRTADPSLRSYLVRDIGASGVLPDVVIQQLKTEDDPSIRSALILMLGGFSSKHLPPGKRKPLVAFLLNLYLTDPDPGIHSAIDWLLRHGYQGFERRKVDWEQRDTLRKIDSSLRTLESKEKKWYVTAKGHTMAICEGPVEFVMGSSGNEPGRDKTDDEALHLERIPRSFAMATKEVTVDQFQQFLESNPEIRKLAESGGDKAPTRDGPVMKRKMLDGDCPQILVTWFEAAQYCNWLSQQDGIPQEEWCYPSLGEIREGMRLPKDYLHRTGYRMPTEAEWEYACRAGSSTSRFYGQSEELLREYAWYTGTSFNERPWPVGQRKPNDFGLFDVYGSVWEWGQDWVKRYQSAPGDSIWVDREDSILVVSQDYKRPRKGGSYTYGADFLRSAQRSNGYIPDERRDSVGFRVARTVRKNPSDGSSN